MEKTNLARVNRWADRRGHMQPKGFGRGSFSFQNSFLLEAEMSTNQFFSPLATSWTVTVALAPTLTSP
jgi:hypothetical protein